MWHRSRQTLILSTPGGAVHAITVLFCGWYSDKKVFEAYCMLGITYASIHRLWRRTNVWLQSCSPWFQPLLVQVQPSEYCGPTMPHLILAILIGLNGSGEKGALLFGKCQFMHMGSITHPALAAYLVASFGSALSTVYAYNASNTAGHTKKSTINAMTLVAFSIGNIIGTETFLPKDAPDYIPGKITIMVLLTVQLGVCFLLRWINIRLNVKKRAKISEEKARRGWSDADIQRERERYAFADLTDKEYVFF